MPRLLYRSAELSANFEIIYGRIFDYASVSVRVQHLVCILMSEKQKGYAAGYVLTSALICTLLLLGSHAARAEYGDIVINNYADAAGVSPVIFPHWLHRMRFTCNVCHADLGFKLKAGSSGINMAKIMDGQFCGACHNGSIAWNVENCSMCHSAKLGTPTQVHEGKVQEFSAPVRGKNE